MSFQDVGRRQHPIFDKHRGETREQRTTPSKSNRSRTVGESMGDEFALAHHYPKSHQEAPTQKQRHSYPTMPPKKHNLPKEERGVRPRLSTTCPVTSRNLLEDNMSLASATVVTQESRTDVSDEESIPPPVRRSPFSSSRSQSVFSTLTGEIVNFQKMVADLEQLLQSAGSSPETQWRSRIIIRSAQDADRDICAKLYEFEESQQGLKSSSRAQVATRKLQRDFGRVHQDFQNVMAAYEQRQQVEISFLTRDEEQKEEFFDRAMREREEEVQQIHQSMNQVNAIYKDLAYMVDGQQGQIDRITEVTEDSKANTRSGLEHIQNGMLAWCGPVEGHSSSSKNAQAGEEGYRVEEEFVWTMPFETLGDDMRSVQADVFLFGRNLVEGIHDNVQEQIMESSCRQACDCQEEAETKVQFQHQ